MTKNFLASKLHHNKIIWALTFSDIFAWGAYTVVASLAGLYLAKRIDHDIVSMIGIGTGIYFLFRALVQLPVGKFVDERKGYTDEAAVLFVGTLLMGMPFFLYPLVSIPWQYYLLQGILGSGSALNVNAWRKLFASSLDRGHEGREYATYDVVMSTAIAVLTIVSGQVANVSDTTFSVVMVGMGVVTILGGVCGAVVYLFDKKAKKA